MEKYTIIKVKEYDVNSGRLEIKDGVASIVDLVEVEREIQIDNSRSVKKWKPVLEALKIDIDEQNIENRVFSEIDPYGEENWDEDKCDFEVNPFALFTAVYAEFHSLRENFGHGVFGGENPAPLGNNPQFLHLGEIGQNLLPVSMKILSQLNIKDKKYEIKNRLPVKEISLKINIKQCEDIRAATGMDIVQKLESAIVQMLVDQINKELETKNTIYIESLVNSLSLIYKEDRSGDIVKNYPTLVLRSKYEVI